MKKGTLLGVTIIFLLFSLFFFLPPIDTDFGWHLRYGEYFLQNLKPMRGNQLTYLLPDYDWQLSYLLYDAATALVYQKGGLLGLSLTNSLFFGILGVIIFFYTGKSLLSSFLVLLSTTIFGWGSLHLGFRAQNFALLGSLLTLYFLKKGQEDRRFFFLIPILTFFWVNTHGSFVLSLIIFGFFVISCFLTQKKVSPPELLAFLLTILAGLVTPFGLGGYQEAFRHAFYPLKLLIAEWVPPHPYWQIFILAASLASFFLLLKKGKENLFCFLILSFFAWQAIFARRNLPLYGFVLGITFVRILSLQVPSKKFLLKLEKTLLPLIFISTIFLFLIIQVPKTINFAKDENIFCHQGMLPYPCQATSWVKSQPFLGKNVYSAYEWGGFLAWKLPEYKPFVDGRMPTWKTPSGKSPYTLYLEIIQAQPSWDKELEKYATDWLLIGSGTFLDLELKKTPHPTWKLVYQDEIASIYAKRQKTASHTGCLGLHPGVGLGLGSSRMLY